METPKRSAHKIWREAKEKNLTKEETKKLLVKEGVIVKKSDHNTLYRKVTFEINDKNHDETWLIGKSANFIFNPNTRNGEELSDFLAGCEEITDTSHQIEKLEAEKAELLEILNETFLHITPLARFLKEPYQTGLKSRAKSIESLIQKHKKCQENTPR